ncbi:MAG TPA: hypothetical protein VF944_05485 [Candidatus Bathyarchaeia archaeon]
MDKATGGIEAHVVMDVLTWIETFFLNLTRNGDNSTRVIMDRIGVAQPFDWGIARQYVKSFLSKLGKHSKEHWLEHGVNESSLVLVGSYKDID